MNLKDSNTIGGWHTIMEFLSLCLSSIFMISKYHKLFCEFVPADHAELIQCSGLRAPVEQLCYALTPKIKNSK